jgi:hypothetical protein
MELWKDIAGYENRYQVSDYGRVRSLRRKYRKEDIMLKQIIDYKGYSTVGLTMNCKTKFFKVHRLVAQSFLDNPLCKPQINHINCIKDDNSLENIEWCTNGENQLHAYKNKRKFGMSGEDNPNSKLKKNDVIEIRRLYRDKEKTQVQIAKEYKLNYNTVNYIINYRLWRLI